MVVAQLLYKIPIFDRSCDHVNCFSPEPQNPLHIATPLSVRSILVISFHKPKLCCSYVIRIQLRVQRFTHFYQYKVSIQGPIIVLFSVSQTEGREGSSWPWFRMADAVPGPSRRSEYYVHDEGKE